MSSDKRTAILEAAVVQFAMRGYHGTTVPQIADAAGVGAGTIYRHFETKLDLVNLLYAEAKSRLRDRLDVEVVDGVDARSHFAAMWDEMVEFAREEPMWFAFLEFHDHRSYLDAERRELARCVDEELEAMFAALIEGGRVKAVEPAIMIAMVWGGFVALAKQFWDGERVDISADRASAAFEFAWEAIRAR